MHWQKLTTCKKFKGDKRFRETNLRKESFLLLELVTNTCCYVVTHLGKHKLCQLTKLLKDTIKTGL